MAPRPQKSPLGQDINSVAARIEKQCVKKAGMTPEEIKTDFHALRKEISESIRPKWDAFELPVETHARSLSSVAHAAPSTQRWLSLRAELRTLFYRWRDCVRVNIMASCLCQKG
ncbi:hypothetical protein MRX96_046709 [Rhipicephalus microplus]